MKESKTFYTKREVAAALNNSVIACLRIYGGSLSSARLRKLREYSMAVIRPLLEHVDEELLSAEELTFVLSSSALAVFCLRVAQNIKVPGLAMAENIDAEALNEDAE